ncbi:hypothetical protein DL769_002881 [Monosporascus sp. CRB-8-3]|nr:hypothetical protein DL769_002881 [Monosporascus sp. CRB-8-3]
MPRAELRATYASPHNAPLSLATPLDLPAAASSSSSTSPSAAEKAAYLRGLRAATAALQERVNGELTARMEEDKAREASAAGGGGGGGVATDAGADKGKGGKSGSGGGGGAKDIDEDAEEENYGEEVVEDD